MSDADQRSYADPTPLVARNVLTLAGVVTISALFLAGVYAHWSLLPRLLATVWALSVVVYVTIRFERARALRILDRIIDDLKTSPDA